MQVEVNGQTVELSEAGWLNNLDEWSRCIGHHRGSR